MDPFGEFENRGYFIPGLRRSTVLPKDRTLIVFYSRIGDAPEGILATTVDLSVDWDQWEASEPVAVMLPEMDYEKSQYPIEPSRPDRDIAVRQLRDPCIFVEDGKVHLFYSVASEMGIAMADLEIRMRQPAGP